MEFMSHLLEQLKKLFDVVLFRIGKTEVDVWTLLYLLILIFLLFYLSGKMKELLVKNVLLKGKMDYGARQALGSIIRYFVIAIGLLIILQTAGINLTTLQVLAGTVGIGVGFGLQNIASNFVSGIIILFERPIKIGDRIEVGKVEGDVIAINARSTTVVTNDNIAIIIPNSKFITENIVNWSLTGHDVRFRIPINVAYDSDLHLVEEVLMGIAKENPDVLENPNPAIRLINFGDNGILFELRVWSTTLTHRKGLLISALNFAIYEKFKENGIEMQTPLYDIHILRDKHRELKLASENDEVSSKGG